MLYLKIDMLLRYPSSRDVLCYQREWFCISYVVVYHIRYVKLIVEMISKTVTKDYALFTPS